MNMNTSLETELRDRIEKLSRQNTGLITALKYLIRRAESIDAILLKFTDSSRDCEIGEITRARAAIAEAEEV